MRRSRPGRGSHGRRGSEPGPPHAGQCPAGPAVRSWLSSEELPATELLDNGSERDGGKERESADDENHADYQADEHAIVGAERPKRTRNDVLGRQRPPHGAKAGIILTNRPSSMSTPPTTL